MRWPPRWCLEDFFLSSDLDLLRSPLEMDMELDLLRVDLLPSLDLDLDRLDLRRGERDVLVALPPPERDLPPLRSLSSSEERSITGGGVLPLALLPREVSLDDREVSLVDRLSPPGPRSKSLEPPLFL